MEIDSSSDDDDDAHRPAPTEIDAAIDEGAAELQRLRDRRAKKVRGTSAAVSIVPTISGGRVGDKLAQTLRRTVGGGRAPTAHRRDRASDTRLHAAVKVGDAVVVSQLLQGSARGQLNARQGSDGNTPLHLVSRSILPSYLQILIYTMQKQRVVGKEGIYT